MGQLIVLDRFGRSPHHRGYRVRRQHRRRTAAAMVGTGSKPTNASAPLCKTRLDWRGIAALLRSLLLVFRLPGAGGSSTTSATSSILGILVLTYVMPRLGLNIVAASPACSTLGYGRLLRGRRLSYALLSTNSAIILGLPAARRHLAACWGVLLGFPVLRLRGDYLAIVTLAFGETPPRHTQLAKPDRWPQRCLRHCRVRPYRHPLTPGDDGLAAQLGIDSRRPIASCLCST